jgi:hypothetical protein
MLTRIIVFIAALFSTAAIVVTMLGAAAGAALANTNWHATRASAPTAHVLAANVNWA